MTFDESSIWAGRKIEWPLVSIGWQVGIILKEPDDELLFKTSMKLFNDAFDAENYNPPMVKGYPLCSVENENTFRNYVQLSETSLEDAFKSIKSWGLYPKTVLTPGITEGLDLDKWFVLTDVPAPLGLYWSHRYTQSGNEFIFGCSFPRVLFGGRTPSE